MQDEKHDFDSLIFPATEITAYTNVVVEILSDDKKWITLSRNLPSKDKKVSLSM